jgi:hypothetical protein
MMKTEFLRGLAEVFDDTRVDTDFGLWKHDSNSHDLLLHLCYVPDNTPNFAGEKIAP